MLPHDHIYTAIEQMKQQSDDVDYSSNPTDAPTVYIRLYKEASAYIEALQDFQKECKGRMSDWMTEMQQTSFECEDGKCGISAPSVYYTYDKRALDALFQSDDFIRRALEPHRKQVSRDGTMYIR